MTHGSLFSGIGGFDLAAQWMGWQNVFQVEINEHCQKVLKKNFPTTKKYGDIKEFDGRKYMGTVDVISGGFPCQPHSKAGKQLGEKDDRDLWSECKRGISEIRPKFALFENVSALLTSDGGRFFNGVLSDLAEIGYDAEWCCLPASVFGAPHIRERIWIISYPHSIIGTQSVFIENGKEKKEWNKKTQIGCKDREFFKMASSIYCGIRIDKEWLPEPGIPKLVNGIPSELDEIRGYGNAIVPKVAHQIFKVIEAINLQTALNL